MNVSAAMYGYGETFFNWWFMFILLYFPIGFFYIKKEKGANK
jgi:hypothetical protein